VIANFPLTNFPQNSACAEMISMQDGAKADKKAEKKAETKSAAAPAESKAPADADQVTPFLKKPKNQIPLH
jgi:hypothetical protein